MEDFEASNVKDADEELALGFHVERLVDACDQPVEHARVQRLGDGAQSEVDLVQILTFGHHLVSDLHLRLQQRLEEVVVVDAEQVRHFLGL